MSPDQRLHESVLMRERWSLIQSGTSRNHIRIRSMYVASCMAGSWTLSLSVKLKAMPPLSPTALVRDQIHPLSSETNSLAIMFMSIKLLTSLMYPLLMTLVHNIDHLHLWVTIPLLLPLPNPMFPLPSHDYLYVPLYVCLMHET